MVNYHWRKFQLLICFDLTEKFTEIKIFFCIFNIVESAVKK